MRLLLLLLCALVSASGSAQVLTAAEFIGEQPASSDVSSFEISNDGQHLYTVSGTEALIGAFSIDQNTGSLVSIDSEVTGLASDAPNTTIHLSANGQFFYAGGFGSDGLALYSRDMVSGSLTLIDADSSQLPPDQDIITFVLSLDNLNLYLITSTTGQTPNYTV